MHRRWSEGSVYLHRRMSSNNRNRTKNWKQCMERNRFSVFHWNKVSRHDIADFEMFELYEQETVLVL